MGHTRVRKTKQTQRINSIDVATIDYTSRFKAKRNEMILFLPENSGV
jgi:hypothetical protein